MILDPSQPALLFFICIHVKSNVPLILELNKLNYDARLELFLTHFCAYGVHGYLDSSIKPKDSTDADWDNLDNLVKSWLYGSMTYSLLTMILKLHHYSFHLDRP